MLAAGGARIVRDRAREVIALDLNRGPLADRTVPALSAFWRPFPAETMCTGM